MQEHWQAFFLGLIQGICEFLPVSSSGHLVLFELIFNTFHDLTFVLLVHLATLFSILTVMRKTILQLIKLFISDVKNRKYGPGMNIFFKVVIGSLPAGFIGVFFKNKLMYFFTSPITVSYGFLFTAFLLLITHFFYSSQRMMSVDKMISALSRISYKQAVFIGFFQALAIVPGISRSGSTIAGGLFLRLNTVTAVYFSFFLAVPAILGATILQLSLEGSHLPLNILFIGFLSAYLMGCLSLWLLLKVALKGYLKYFSVYLCLLAVMMFFIS